ncbi:MAG TPA: hypothetical protein DET40_17450 [Lentisphaeria bacterium]|nr:MAG: hypothetical protein A2X45_02555 [Lentisphaerae bacterium GWF2_50_93]HCE45328.1 hypothetical protein [Lentisphaeria bacterium]
MATDVTIVIPTYNQRYKDLRRLLEYYNYYDGLVFVADSSSSPYPYNYDLEKVKYFHLPELGYYEKIIYVLNLVNTEFVVLCADDDFIVPKGIQTAVSFLKLNSEYSVAKGKQICFLDDMSEKGKYVWRESDWDCYSIEDPSPSKRLFMHLSSYKSATFYAVHRTNLMRDIFRLSFDNSDDYLFGEYILSLLAIIRGKYKIFDQLYAIRTSHPTSNPHSFYKFIMNGTFDEKYKKFRKVLSKELVNSEDISLPTAEKLIDSALAEYLKNENLTLSGLRAKANLKNIINSIGLLDLAYSIKYKLVCKNDYTYKYSNILSQPKNPYEDPSNLDYNEFVLIKNIVEGHQS